jgi:hypothetical protein
LVAPAGGRQVWQVAPQAWADSCTHCAPQRTKPGLQLNSQAVPVVQTATALAGGVHGEQLLPQVATSKFETQSAPQAWNPVAQAKLQVVPSHAAVALGGCGQAAQLVVPQLLTLKFETQALPQR